MKYQINVIMLVKLFFS